MGARVDLLLTHAHRIAEDAGEQRVMKPYPALGLLYLKAYLERVGFHVGLHDPTFDTRQLVEARLARREADVLGVYVNLTTRGPALALIERARALGWTIVLGGPEPANHAARYLEAGADVIVHGEGERTMQALLPALASGGPHRLDHIAGLSFRDQDGLVVTTPARPTIRDLDALPWPDREAIDVPAYLACWRSAHGRGALNLITARGCPYRCRWCSHAVFGYHHARRSPEDVAAELAHLRERWSPDMVWYADDVFSISPRWLARYADIVTARGIGLPFECITRADRVDAEVAENLARLGCFRVWIGSESGSQRILDAMERGVTTAQVEEATQVLRAAGIQVGLFLMWGYEGEEPADIDATIRHVARVDPDTYLTTVAYPIEGTPYHAEVAERVVPLASWREGSDRLRTVAGRPSPRYYALATKRLRHAVQLARLQDPASGSAHPGAWVAAAAGERIARVQMRGREAWYARRERGGDSGTGTGTGTPEV